MRIEKTFALEPGSQGPDTGGRLPKSYLDHGYTPENSQIDSAELSLLAVAASDAGGEVRTSVIRILRRSTNEGRYHVPTGLAADKLMECMLEH